MKHICLIIVFLFALMFAWKAIFQLVRCCMTREDAAESLNYGFISVFLWTLFYTVYTSNLREIIHIFTT